MLDGLAIPLDLEGMPYLDSSGIGSIVNALRITSRMGCAAELVKPSSFVAKTFKICGILGLFGVY